MKIYRVEKEEWREGDFRRGESWRCDAIYKCRICHTKTNMMEMGGYPCLGPKLICPGDSYKQHDELERALGRYASARIKLKEYSNAAKGRNLLSLRLLEEEKGLLARRIRQLRRRFAGLDDIMGIPTDSKEEYYYPSARICGNKKNLKRI